MSNAKVWSCVILAGVVAAGVSVSVMAEEAAKPAATQPSPEQMQAMMEKVAAPGPQHAMLAKYAGDFTAEVQMWMDPAAPPMKSVGKQKNELALGGRYLMGTYEGEMMGKPFHGMSCSGYDNLKKKYFSAWIDDMSTGLMSAEGDADEAGKTITMSGEMMCPMIDKPQKFREVTKFVDADTYNFEMYATTPEGKEFKTMEIVYKRVAAPK